MTSLILGLVGIGFEAIAVVVGVLWNAHLKSLGRGDVGAAKVSTWGALIAIVIMIAIAGKLGLIGAGFGIGAIFGSRGRGRRLGVYGLILGFLAALPALTLLVVIKVGERAHW